jgi:hypothetical protein
MAQKQEGQDEGGEMPVRGVDGHVQIGEILECCGVEKKTDGTGESWRTSLERGIGRNGIVRLGGCHRYDYNCI